jgi:hypothetical protein
LIPAQVAEPFPAISSRGVPDLLSLRSVIDRRNSGAPVALHLIPLAAVDLLE